MHQVRVYASHRSHMGGVKIFFREAVHADEKVRKTDLNNLRYIVE
jgi:hypothetical protein